MKILLPPSVADQLAGVLDDCYRGETSPDILAGQVMRGDWQEGTDKVFLFLAQISPTTARKIRKLLEADRAKQASRVTENN